MGYLNYDPVQSVVEVNKGVSVGTIVEFPYNTIGAGYLLCDGNEFDEAIHVELFKFLGTNKTPIVIHEYRVGDVKWFPKRTHIHPDFVPADGQLLNYSDYPDVQPMVNQDKVHQTTDSNFSNDAHYRGFWMTDLPNVFRVPDMNGNSLNSLGSVFIRGDGRKSNGNALIQDCMIQSHDHGINPQSIWRDLPKGGGQAPEYLTPITTAGGRWFSTDYDPNVYNLSTQRSGGDETRSTNIAGCWGVRVKQSTVFAIKAYGSVDNEGNFDLDALAQENIKLKDEVAKLKDKPILSLNGNTNGELSAVNGSLTPKYAMVLNEGFDYNSALGTVVIPKNGVYRIQFSYTSREGATTPTSNSTAAIYINGAKHTVMANYYQPALTASTITTSSCEIMFRLKKGDVIKFDVEAVNGTQTMMWSPGQFNCEFIKE